MKPKKNLLIARNVLLFIVFFFGSQGCLKTNTSQLKVSSVIIPNVPACDGGYWDFKLGHCVLNPVCGAGYHLDYNTHQCVADATPNYSPLSDSIQRPTILGPKLTNPYELGIMAQAYANLGITNVPVVANNQYVRFLPSDINQLNTLFTLLESQNLDLDELPTEYNTDVEGDYYQDPSFTAEQIPWLYSTVPVGYQFPAGISYQIISQIHIPGDNYTAVETEAERIAASIDAGGGLAAQPLSRIIPNVPQCGIGYHWDFKQGKCVFDGTCPTGFYYDPGTNSCLHYPNCPTGYYRDVNGQCLPNPVTYPAPAPDAAVPAGYLTVNDTQLASSFGVRNVKVIAKRWFKREVTYTDNNGHFQFSKRFKHKVKIKVRFTNSFASIRSIRGARFWNLLFPVRENFGIFSGDKSNLSLNINRYIDGTKFSRDKGNQYWAAATYINAVQEHAEYAAQLGFTPAPLGINILITTYASAAGDASTPMFNKRGIFSVPESFPLYFALGSLVSRPLTAVVTFLVSQVDIFVDYNYSTTGDFTSDNLKETLYHELSHASHYNKLPSWYPKLVDAEIAENSAADNAHKPYGPGNNYNSPIIALGEAWGYHMGHYLANLRYGTSGSPQSEDQFKFSSDNIGSHINVLEGWTPNSSYLTFPLVDPFIWIPKGLMEDLIDIGEPTYLTGVTVNVSGFTIQQLFNALQSDVYSPQNFRDRLILQNPNNQSSQVSQLFTQYNYN